MRGRALIAGSTLAVVAGGLWLIRAPVATTLIDRWAARNGVPVRYRIVSLGPGRQRLADVVVGNPASPDLTADWVETGTAFGWDGIRVTTIRAGHVLARARWRDGRLSFGSLDRLQRVSGAGPDGLPSYDLGVADARLEMMLPAGGATFRLAGEGRLNGGFAGRLSGTAPRLAAAVARRRSWRSTDGYSSAPVSRGGADRWVPRWYAAAVR